MKSFLLYLCLIFLNCILLTASTIDSDSINRIFTQDSTLPADLINKIDFKDFDFEVGIEGTPRIVSNIKGGRILLKWADDGKSMIQIRVFAQKRNDEYVEELDVPMDILNGISSENSIAALGTDKLRESWKASRIKDIGNYCVGQHLAAYGASVVSSGYFFNQDYGFCLHISSPDGSGVGLGAVENIGKIVMVQIAKKIQDDGVTPNPLNKSGSFVIAEKTGDKEVNEVSKEEDSPKIIHRENNTQKHSLRSETGSTNKFWGIAVLVVALTCVFLVWRRISKT